MKVMLHSTTKIVELNGARARVWEGETEHGVPVMALIPRIQPQTHDEGQLAVFASELEHATEPQTLGGKAIDIRLVI